MPADIPLSEPPRTRLSLWAILLGSFVDIMLSYVAAVPIIAFFGDRVVIPLLVSGLTMTAIGGYVAAAAAGRRSLAHGLGVGILSTVIGLALGRLIGDDSPIQFPVWYEGVAYGLTIPAAVLGGWLRRRFWGERLVATGLRAGVYPDLKQAVWLLVLFMLVTVGVSIAAGLAVAAAIRGRISLLQWVVPAIVAGATVGYALVLAWATRKSRAPVAEIFPFKMVPVASIWPAVATIVGIAILFADLTILIRRASSIPRVPIDPTNIFGGLERGFWPAVIIIVILAPIAEELLFRGVILRGLLSHYTTRKAILVSSVLFGVSHVNPVLIAAATVLGMLFAWWRVRTGSLLLPCLGHCLNNATALAISRLPWVTDPAFMSAEAGRVFQPLWFGLAGVVLLLLGIWQFRRVAVA